MKIDQILTGRFSFFKLSYDIKGFSDSFDNLVRYMVMVLKLPLNKVQNMPCLEAWLFVAMSHFVQMTLHIVLKSYSIGTKRFQESMKRFSKHNQPSETPGQIEPLIHA